MTKTIGEQYVSPCSRHDWAPALTRDGLARTDILAVHTAAERRMIGVQVKSIRGVRPQDSWPLGIKEQKPALDDHEWFVLVAIDPNPTEPMRCFVVPRNHVAAGAWIEHTHWMTEPGIPAGKRTVDVDRARSALATFERYENRWDLLLESAYSTPALLPPVFRDYALDEARVGLPPDHPWKASLPPW